MYRGIIEHRISVTEYLRDQILARKLDRPTGLGRIYRVVHESTTRDRMASGLSRASNAELVLTLGHPNGWWRDTAHRLLVERHATDAAPALIRLASAAPDWRVRLRALWILDGLEAIAWNETARALEDEAPSVRRAAVRIAERWLAEPGHAAHRAVMSRIDDEDAGVRRQLAASLGMMPPGVREAAVARVLERFGEDPITVDAALSGVRGGELTLIEELVRRADDARHVDATAPALAMLSAVLVRSGRGDDLQRVFGTIADESRARSVRSALLQGMEIALLGAALPGTPARGQPAAAANMPCPTCPGGRGGPGGAYAFGGPPARPASREPRLRLQRAPELLVALSQGAGDLAERTARVLDRVAWPGKAGEAPVEPLTAVEQQRFAAGREVYLNVCQSCHQPDGRGQEGLAPALVGSPMVLASPAVPARILLHGKEGGVGLMPPVGGVLTDDQIAGVLTYVRREWGQTGSPVHPADVADVRKRTANRTSPWTDAELLKLIER
jgi:mono/diheme cytochrome c family protein